MDPFVRAALVGVEKDAPPSATGTAVDVLFADDADFLRRAGARHLYVRAGFVPPRVAEEPEVAPRETLATPSPRLEELVAEIVEEGERDLLRLAAQELANARHHFPHRLLPELLGMREKALLPVVGERGRWLARKNREWAWAAGGTLSTDLDARWEEGTIAQRVEALREMRAADPAAARAKLLEVWSKEKAEQRLALLAALEVGLSSDDEDFLENALGGDRSMNVKGAAADLLARLPRSRFVARMQARAEALVTMSAPPSSFLSKLKGNKPKLIVALPAARLDATAARDIVPARAPQSSGVRAWVLTQIVAAVPLSAWTSRFGATPQQLMAMAGETLYPAALIEGWLLALPRDPDPEWARAFLAVLPNSKVKVSEEQAHGVLRALPPAELLELAKTLKGREGFWHRQCALELLPVPWPAGFAREWLQETRAAAAKGAEQAGWYDLCAMLPQHARAIPESVFAAALEPWTITEDAWQQHEWTRQLRRFHQIIAIRKVIAEEKRP